MDILIIYLNFKMLIEGYLAYYSFVKTYSLVLRNLNLYVPG